MKLTARGSDMLNTLKDQRGIAIIWVAIGMASILGFAVLALDLSAIQTTRTQLQNAADAAALAAASELLPDGRPLQQRKQDATQTAIGIAGLNRAFIDNTVGPVVISSADVTFPNNTRVTVRTHRTQATGDPLRTYFIQLIPPYGDGLADVTADASAELVPGGATNGFFPWVLPDRFDDVNENDRWNDAEPFDDADGDGEWDEDESFDDEDKDGVYDPSDFYDPVLTGYQTPADAGLLLEVKQGDPQNTVVPSFYYPGRFPPLGYFDGTNPQGGGAVYRDWIINKSPYFVRVGDVLRLESGNMQGPTKQGCKTIIDACPSSYYDPADSQVKGHSHDISIECPRIGAIAFFDPSNVQGAQDKEVTVVKLSLWFVVSVGEPQNTVRAILLELIDPNAVPGPPSGGFIHAVRLVE